MYVEYVIAKYGPCSVIIFDGYLNGPSTKDHEHSRRSTKSSANIIFEPAMKPTTDLQSFFANMHNKKHFISVLKMYLENADLRVKQAESDADTLIASNALRFASEKEPVTVICDDTDVLVLLVYHFKPDMSDIYMRSDPKRGQKKGLKLYSIRDIQAKLGCDVILYVLSIHAWSGCDTTSAIFSKGKSIAMNKILGSVHARELLTAIGTGSSTPAEVGKAGVKLFLFMYGGNTIDSLACVRYNSYMKMSASGKPLQPERMPPTERAARFHSLRVHAQIVDW